MQATIAPSQRAARKSEMDQSLFLVRWLKVWVTLLTVVTLVVVVYLIVITNSLDSINDNLASVTDSVVGAGNDVVTLPDQVERVNGSLAGIDPALKPIPGQADAIIASLTSIDGKLRTTDGSLRDTDSILKVVLSNANTIQGVLVDADDPPDRFGVQNIHRRVAKVNGVGAAGEQGSTTGNLTLAEQDAANINQGLTDANRHLDSICRNAALELLSPGRTC
ncbi:MAG: hypothetical protein ACRD0F_08595 [Acidimicrobiales bacterium]